MSCHNFQENNGRKAIDIDVFVSSPAVQSSNLLSPIINSYIPVFTYQKKNRVLTFQVCDPKCWKGKRLPKNKTEHTHTQYLKHKVLFFLLIIFKVMHVDQHKPFHNTSIFVWIIIRFKLQSSCALCFQFSLLILLTFDTHTPCYEM